MIVIRVTRTYKVTIEQEDLDRIDRIGSGVVGNLADTCTRAADAGDLTGRMYLVIDEGGEPDWIDDPEGFDVIDQVDYEAEEEWIEHSVTPPPTM